MIELYPPDISIQLHSYKNQLGYLYRETPPLSGPGVSPGRPYKTYTI